MSNVSADNYSRALRALDLISQGVTPTQACDQAGTSTYWLKRFAAEDPLFQELAVDAHERGYDTLADVLLKIDTHPTYGSSDPRMASILSSNIKWYLEKRDSARYGAKVVVENRITADRAIVDALSRGKQRALEQAKGAVIDVIAEDVTPKN